MDSLTGLAAFVHAADQRSYVAAARILGVSSSAIAKTITRLEAKLGVRLLNRTTRSIGLTEAGKLFYERCKRIIDDLDDAEAMVSETKAKPSGRLRISVPHIFGHHLLLPQLPDFMRRFPDIELEIDFDDQVVDIVALGLDLAVRSGDLADTRLIARRLGEQHFVVCGSLAYLDRHGRPAKPADLGQHTCIHFKYPSTGRLAPWSFAPPDTDPRLPTSLIFNNTDAGLWAAVAGLGLAHLPAYVANPEIDAGRLEPVLTESMVPFGSLSLVWPSNKQLSPKVRAFVDFIVERLGATVWKNPIQGKS
jgi:DNA-binding transcriptional LysR family regulator